MLITITWPRVFKMNFFRCPGLAASLAENVEEHPQRQFCILPAIETAHAMAGARNYARRHPGKHILVGFSGRGDKDLPTLRALETRA